MKNDETENTQAKIQQLRQTINESPSNPKLYFELGSIYYDQHQFQDAIPHFQQGLKIAPNNPMLLFILGLSYEKSQNLILSIQTFQNLLQAQPNHTHAKIQLSKLIGKIVPQWHFPMLADTTRNQAYEQMIQEQVKPGMTILDIGTGSGLLAMLAIRAGAKHVYACEQNPLIAQTAKNIVQLNKMEDQISIISKQSETLIIGQDIPDKLDGLIMEIFDVGLLGEGVLPVLAHAKNHLLKPNPMITPDKAIIYAQLCQCDQLYSQYVLNQVCQFDVSPFNTLRKSGYHQISLSQFDHTILSAPTSLFTFEFYQPIQPNEEKHITIQATRTGKVNCLVAWFQLFSDQESIYDSSPANPSHWQQAVFFLPKAISVKKNQQITLSVCHSSAYLLLEIIKN